MATWSDRPRCILVSDRPFRIQTGVRPEPSPAEPTRAAESPGGFTTPHSGCIASRARWVIAASLLTVPLHAAAVLSSQSHASAVTLAGGWGQDWAERVWQTGQGRTAPLGGAAWGVRGPRAALAGVRGEAPSEEAPSESGTGGWGQVWVERVWQTGQGRTAPLGGAVWGVRGPRAALAGVRGEAPFEQEAPSESGTGGWGQVWAERVWQTGQGRTAPLGGAAWGVRGPRAALAGVRGEAPSEQEALDSILAVVDGHVIMHSDVRAFIDLALVDDSAGPDQEANVLTYLIDRRLVLDRVDRFVVAEPSAADVDRRLEIVQQGFSTEEEIMSVLERVGLTSDDLRQVLADEIRLETYLEDRFAAVGNLRRADATAEWVAGLVERAQVMRVGGDRPDHASGGR